MIENYYNQAKGEEKREDVIRALRLLENSDYYNSPLAFFDMKEGIEIKKWQENEEYKNYWKQNLDNVKYEYDENEYIVKGFGMYLLRKINAFLDREINKEDFYEKNIDEYVSEAWEDIGRVIYSYGCARPKIYCF